MTRAWLAAAAAAALIATAPASSRAAPSAGSGRLAPSSSRVARGSFRARSLGVDKSYVVYLPASYGQTGRRYPTIYMLHGLGGSEGNWTELFELDRAADRLALEAIVVMPDGDDSFYSNAASSYSYADCLRGKGTFSSDDPTTRYCVRTPRYEDYITRDLVAHIDRRFRTVADRSFRAIGGLSMGGYGALYLAFRHPELFSIAISHSGVASLLYAGPYPYRPNKGRLADAPEQVLARLGRFRGLFEHVFGTTTGNWREHDPVVLSDSIRPGALDIYMDCGDADGFQLQHAAQFLSERLAARGIDHEWHLIAGGKHDADLWRVRIEHSLRFASQRFAGRQSKMPVTPAARSR